MSFALGVRPAVGRRKSTLFGATQAPLVDSASNTRVEGEAHPAMPDEGHRALRGATRAPLIDTHCHIYGAEFDADRDAVIRRAQAAGVTKMVVVGTDLPSSRQCVALAEKYPFLFATVGLHPHDSHLFSDAVFSELAQLCGHPRVVGIGETGLDYYYGHSTPADQRRAFLAQIALAKQAGLPLVIHTREAWEETFSILHQEGMDRHAREVGAVFHCFTGDRAIAERAIAIGFYLSFSGIVTFPKSVTLQEAAACADLERLLIETDSPYLAPQGFRGKRNEPAYVRAVAEKMASLHAVTPEEMALRTTRNAERLFKFSAHSQ